MFIIQGLVTLVLSQKQSLPKLVRKSRKLLTSRSGVVTLGFLIGGKDARQGKETKISPTTKIPSDYELVIFGTPVWAGKPSPAINTYLKKNNLSGKKVAAFFTKGQGKSQAVEETKMLVPNSTWVGELLIINPLKNKENAEKQILEWCKTIVAN